MSDDYVYTVEANVSTVAPEAVIEIPGLGAVKNGSKALITRELAAQYKAYNGHELPEGNFQVGIKVQEYKAPPQEKKAAGKKAEEKGDS